MNDLKNGRDKNRPICGKCLVSMHKAGFIWSGKNRVQRYRCNVCGKTTVINNP